MIITDSVYHLINELCSSLNQTECIESHQTSIKQSKLKTLKGRMHEILLKTSPTQDNGVVMKPHELYLHELECKMNGESAAKCSAMKECCRLVERDEYFQSDIGQSVMAFLLKLRNTRCDQNEQRLPNYFFNSSLFEQSPYFFLPPDMLRFSEDKRGLLRYRQGDNVCEKSYFGIPVECQSNKLIVSSLVCREDDRLKLSSIEPIHGNNSSSNTAIDSTIIRCGRWDNLGQPMDYLNARFSSEVDCTNQLLAIATSTSFEVKFMQLPQFIADIKLLLTGIPSDSFHLDAEKMIFHMEENLSVENISPETMASSVVSFLECGSCYRRLQLLLARNPVDFKHKFDGFVFKTLSTGVSTFLMAFNQFVYMFDDTFIAQMLLRMSSMIQQIEILSHILRVHPKSTIPMEKALAVLPRGSEFLNYLYRKFVAVTQNDVAMLLFTILKECCTVYFKKFETWIFHGFIEDPYKELFIEFVDFYQPNTKHFWDKAYTIKRQSVPSFLLGCEDSALLCGKYTMLLKTIKPAHPFLTIPAPSIRVCFSHPQIGALQDISRKYIQDAQILCGPAITVRQVYEQKSEKRKEFRQRCAVRFQENLEQWHKEQMAKRIKDQSNKEKHRKILEEQIEEVRERHIKKRLENLARDREYLRHQEVLENDRIAEENLHRQKTLEYYEELGRIVNEQQQRVTDKIQKLSNELNEKSDNDDDEHDVKTDLSVDDPKESEGSNVITVDLNNPDTISDVHVETNLKKSASDYFNSNDIPSEFTTNKIKVMGSTIEFNDTINVPTSTDNKTLVNRITIDTNRTNDTIRDANSNEVHPTLTARQKNKAKVLQREFDIGPIVVKIDSSQEVSNMEFQKNQQKSGAHTNIFGNEIVDEFQRNRNRVLTEEFGYGSGNTATNRTEKIQITPVDWKPIRTSMSLDFSRNPKNDLDVPTPMSIDTPTIHEEIEEINESKLKIELPIRSEKLFQQSLETLDGNEATPDSALNTCGILKKHGFVFETIAESVPVHRDCYQLSFSPQAGSKNHSFFALPNWDDENEEEPTGGSSLNLNDLENVSSTTLGNFLKMSFAIPIHARLSILNNEILKIFLEDLDILSHLKSLRNFYFMMDGEFSSYISDGLITRLESTKSPTELFNFQFLHNILHNALGVSSVSGNDQNADRLSFLIADVPESFDLASPNVLRTLNLSYRTDWPLNLVLTPEAMTHYANIFQHLLKLRRISWVLEQCFQILKEEGKTSTTNIYTSPQYRHVQLIRSKLLTFVNALQNHITSTALQGSWRAFKIDLESTKSIDDLYHKHAKYLKRVKFLCMLNRGSNEFFIKLEDVLIVILRFYYQLKQRSWRSNNTHPNFDKFLIIEKDFEKLVKFIIRIGSKISRCGYQTEIGDLINVINFNGFYDANVHH